MGQVLLGDCLEVMRGLPPASVDLVFGSPPYEDAREYGELKYKLKGQAWVDWMVRVYIESLRVCKGLVAFVIQGRTQHYEWTATPAMLIVALKQAGIVVRNPPIYSRFGIFGSGGPDWLRADYEWVICATNGGRLPWSDNTAMGGKPKYGPGGVPTHRKQDGSRVNKTLTCGYNPDGSVKVMVKPYIPPERVNPGNIIHCDVGGGKLGSALAHENEAPFPEKLAEFFIWSFCPPGGVVLDCFGGSGTSAAVAIKTGRDYITCDIRESQIELIHRRLAEARRKPPVVHKDNRPNERGIK